MQSFKTKMAELPAADAFRHHLAPGGREALAHMLVLPDAGIAGFLYPSLHEDGAAKVRVVMFGPGVGEAIHEGAEGTSPPEADFDDWSLGDFRMKILEPHRRVSLHWAGDRIRFDGVYEAAFPTYAFSTHPAGMPAYYGEDRTEQHGRVTGTIVIDGRETRVDGWMIRDHSWGPRIWGINQHYKWFHATTAESSVHYFEMLPFGRRELQGYLAKDGVMAHLVDARYEFEFDDGMMQKRFRTWVTDTEGRTAFVDCAAFANTRLDLDPITYLNEAAVTLEIDGAPGSGWCEFCWNKNYFDFAKQYVSTYG